MLHYFPILLTVSSVCSGALAGNPFGVDRQFLQHGLSIVYSLTFSLCVSLSVVLLLPLFCEPQLNICCVFSGMQEGMIYAF